MKILLSLLHITFTQLDSQETPPKPQPLPEFKPLNIDNFNDRGTLKLNKQNIYATVNAKNSRIMYIRASSSAFQL